MFSHYTVLHLPAPQEVTHRLLQSLEMIFVFLKLGTELMAN